MLQQAFIVSTSWYEEGLAVKHEVNQIVIYKAKEFIDNTILRGANGEYCSDFHSKQDNFRCSCSILEDTGIPCPCLAMELLTKQKNITSYVSSEWLV